MKWKHFIFKKTDNIEEEWEFWALSIATVLSYRLSFLELTNTAGGLGHCESPKGGGVLGSKAPLNIKWITLEKFQTVINQQV